MAARDLPLGQVEPEQHLGLLVDRALAGVQVLGLDLVVVEQPARAEADHVAAEVPDRPQQPPVEPVDRALPALPGQPALDQLRQLEAAAQQVLGQLVPAGRRVPAAERRRGRLVEPALGEELARLDRVRRAQLLGVELGRRAVRVDEPGAGALVPLPARRAALVGQLDAGALGEPLDRLDEAQVVDLHQERDDVAALAAAEAVERAVRRPDVERRGLLVVERAQPLQRAAARAAQRHVLAHQVVDPGPLADLRDVALPDPSRHGSESRRAVGQSAGRSSPGRSYDGRVTVSDDVLAEQFAEHRSHLIGVAYRLTSTLSDAEDAVQEAWLRLSGLDEARRAEIRELRAWLTTVVGRICLDRLRSATAQRERYVGPWLPEPIVTAYGAPASDDPLDTVVREDEVRMAAMVVLDRLTPEQRVAFVLHDAFSVPFAEIGEILRRAGGDRAPARLTRPPGRRRGRSAAPDPARRAAPAGGAADGRDHRRRRAGRGQAAAPGRRAHRRQRRQGPHRAAARGRRGEDRPVPVRPAGGLRHGRRSPAASWRWSTATSA